MACSSFSFSIIHLRLLAPALALIALAAPPRDADACSPDICYDVGRWGDIAAGNPQAVPTDGVFVLDGARFYVDTDAEETFPAISVEVSLDGMPVEGALEGVGLGETMIWRPAAPLVAGGAYVVKVSVDNAAIAEGLDGECGPDLLQVELNFNVGDGPAPALAAPAYQSSESYSLVDEITLEGLVCCGGAYPMAEDTCGWEDIYWSTGECAPLEKRGRVAVSWSGGEIDPAYAGMVAYRLKVDGQSAGYRYGAPLGHSDQKPFCANVEVQSLADGSVAAGPEVCLGADPPHPLGLHGVDPLPELGACADAAYTCAIIPGDFGDKWDMNNCQAWPDDAGTTGGETESGSGGSGSGSGDVTDASSGGSGDASTGSDDTSGKTSTATATAGEGEGGEGGCACAADPEGGAAGLGLALIGLVGLRRRRR